jgi:hypothetical protein
MINEILCRQEFQVPNTHNVLMYWIQMNVDMQELVDSNECSHVRIPSYKEFRKWSESVGVWY